MKASKDFIYYLDGNNQSVIKQGDDIPSVALAYAQKNGFCEKAKTSTQNKAKRSPQNKAK